MKMLSCANVLLLWRLLIIVPYQHAVASYQYFAIGSNMVPETMTCLRNLRPLSSQAAILPHYSLAFDIPGNALIEPSAASVRRCPGSVVHGVLYELTENDFARLGSSEGVPFAYRWERCSVIPYVGDSDGAGRLALEKSSSTDEIDAFVLTKSLLVRNDKDIAPSQSYVQVLQRGATFWKLDRDFQDQLAAVKTSNIPGISNSMLQIAERFNPN
jgi:Gamma-glutamyl cyclotransferase, AIG2-like